MKELFSPYFSFSITSQWRGGWVEQVERISEMRSACKPALKDKSLIKALGKCGFDTCTGFISLSTEADVGAFWTRQ